MNQKIVLIRQILVAIILVFSAAAFVSCEKFVYDKPKIDTTIPVLFNTEIAPIFTSNCITCHKGSRSPNLLADKSFESLTNGGYVNTVNPESSKIYLKIVSGHNSSGVSDKDRQKLLAWITQGAKNN